jgi:arylsulfate sulfotransferase
VKIFKAGIPILMLVLIWSCNDDSKELKSKVKDIQKQLDEATNENKLLTLQKILLTKKNDNVLLVDSKEEAGEVKLSFEDNSSLSVDAALLDVVVDPKEWRANFSFTDNSTFVSDFLGDSLRIQKDEVILNPNGTAPLSAYLNYTSKVSGKIHIKVVGQDGENSDVLKQFETSGTNHTENILGLYPDYNNEVVITLTNSEGKARRSQTLHIHTSALPGTQNPTFETITRSEKVKFGFILLEFRPASKPMLVDMFGKVRWFLDIAFPSMYGLQRFNNGNIGFGAASDNRILEYDMMGKKINEWTVLPNYQNIHHDLIELPSGNFVVTVDKKGSATIEDYLLEIDRNSGVIKTIWDLNLILPKRTLFISDAKDWFHNNAVIYSPSDNTLIISGQRMGIVKVTWDNKLKWILSQPGGWTPESEPYLLTSSDNNFEWTWGQHAPLLMPNGDLFLFDNGYGRGFGLEDHYSRAVEFKITEASIGGTVETVWEYGKERGEDLYSPIISDVDYLPETSTRFITAGSLSFNLNYQSNTDITNTWTTDPIKARFIEVTESKEVLFEMVVKSDVVTGSVYRSEKMSIYPD